jgi:hypothetical protein
LILHEHRERAAARPSTATTSIVTQGEPGPLTSRDQTGVFSPSETQAKTIAGDDQAPTSSTASKASLTVKPGVGGSDTALLGGVFRAGVETAPVFVPATNVEARSAADTAGVPRGTGFDGRNVRDPVRRDAKLRIPSGQGSRPPAPSFFGDPSDQRFTRNNNNDHEVKRLGAREGLYLAPGANEGLYSARRCKEIGNDWNATRTWRQPRRHQDCAWAQMSPPAVRGHCHQDVGHLVAHLRTRTKKIQVRLVRSGDSVRSTRQQYGQNCQFTTGGSPEP